MKRKDEKLFLLDIKNSLEKIFRYTQNMSYVTFLTDEKTRDAVERNFEIIGEAVKNLSDEFKSKYPHIPFRQIAGMRDKLIHDYFGVDYEIVWQTIENKLPQFKSEIDKLIEEFEN